MMDVQLIPLAQTSLRDPRSAAAHIIGWDLDRGILWTALALVAILNTFLVTLVVQVSSPVVPLPGYFASPLAMFVLLAGIMVVYVHAMYWAALALGGQGSLNSVLAIVIWYQVLRAGAQVAIVVVSLAIPGLSMLLSLVVAVWGFWIFLNFLATAMHLRGLGQAFAVLVISAIGLVLGLGVLLSLVGLPAQGV